MQLQEAIEFAQWTGRSSGSWRDLRIRTTREKYLAAVTIHPAAAPGGGATAGRIITVKSSLMCNDSKK